MNVATIDTNLGKPKAKPHLYSLDLLRGLAALSVCLLHFTFGVLPSLKNTELTLFFSWGYLGVDIFFIISGFIIPYSLDRGNYQSNEFFSFMGKRMVRIWPPSFLMIILTVGQRLFIDFVLKHERIYTADLTAFQLFTNILYIVPYTSARWLNGILWTLAVEFQFYILIGLLFGWLKRGIVPLIILGGMCNMVKYSPYLHDVQFFEYNSVFLLGILLWLKFRERVSDMIFYLFALVGLVLVYVEINWLAAIFAFGTIFIILFFKKNIIIFSFLGKISYSLYLLHTVVGTTAEALWIRFFSVQTLGQKIALLFFCVLVTVLASYVFYRLVEEPSMRLAERLFKRKTVVVAIPRGKEF
ncbi:acyltransferase [Hymenobacter sp. RP-2-7]|uniref:Acyltransferase n=1 Tax=Hymenobacter polaris TaxID=2682546 RepID=A0A7Y0FPH4_9BACT|nr:acyltransferase [Hymenobacter polaris]NML68067.1 acyltransferase [Hymenobacter polaris]